MCGEKKRLAACAQTAEGSPPRMRGKAFRPAVIARWHRITPACAGKRSARSAACLAGKDHPRVCGEKLHSLSPQLCVHGSPPRVRGKGCCGVGIPLDCGITPACAGKRGEGQGGPAGLWDHPRVCGEKKSAHAVRFHSVGSPPRVRGKAVIMGNLVQGKGITPACAGKRSLRRLASSCTGDHPRVCGEKEALILF